MPLVWGRDLSPLPLPSHCLPPWLQSRARAGQPLFRLPAPLPPSPPFPTHPSVISSSTHLTPTRSPLILRSFLSAHPVQPYHSVHQARLPAPSRCSPRACVPFTVWQAAGACSRRLPSWTTPLPGAVREHEDESIGSTARSGVALQRGVFAPQNGLLCAVVGGVPWCPLPGLETGAGLGCRDRLGGRVGWRRGCRQQRAVAGCCAGSALFFPGCSLGMDLAGLGGREEPLPAAFPELALNFCPCWNSGRCESGFPRP